MVNYAKECPTFWERFGKGRVDPYGKGTYLDNLVTLCKDTHKELHDKLGFEDGVWVQEERQEFVPRTSYTTTLKFLVAMLPPEEQKYMQENHMTPMFLNKLSSGQKVSKYLSKLSNTETLGKLIPLLAETKDDLYDLRTELPKLPADMMDPFTLLTKFPVLVQNFYSEVAASSNVTFGISLSLPTFLEAANSDNFISCYVVGGDFERAPLNWSITPNTFVLYARGGKDNKILGRCWGMVNEDFSQIVLFRAYGFLEYSTIKSAVWWMASRLSNVDEWAMWSVPQLEDIRAQGHIMDNPGLTAGIWSDPVQVVLSKHSLRDRLYFSTQYGVRTAPCIICGSIHSDRGLICSNCKSKYVHICLSCGEHFLNLTGESLSFCSNCLAGLVTCAKCGAKYPESMSECPHCHWDNHCSLCGKPSSVPLYKVGEVFICRDCKEALLSDTCDVCGTKGLMYPIAGFSLCAQCFTKTVATHQPRYTRTAYDNAILCVKTLAEL